MKEKTYYRKYFCTSHATFHLKNTLFSSSVLWLEAIKWRNVFGGGAGNGRTDPHTRRRRKWERPSAERAIFVAKSVSKSKLSHYLAALATFIVGEGRELWRSSLTGQLHSMVAVSGAAANPLASSYRFLSPPLMKGKEGAMTGVLSMY